MPGALPVPFRRVGQRAARACGLALAVALGVTGCAGPTESAATKLVTSRSVEPVVPGPASPTATPTRSESTPALPTLPPGDPGAAPSVPEDTSDVEEPPGAALTTVPAGALLDVETVNAVVGGSWRSVAAPSDSCDVPRPTSAVATRSGRLSSSGGLLTETVATHRGPDAAAAAVSTLSTRLQACGWTLGEEPPLGEDSALLTRRTGGAVDRLVVVASEGVSVTMQGRGAVADSTDDWAAIVDVAIGTSCLAAPDGCH